MTNNIANSKINYWISRPVDIKLNYNEKPYQIISNDKLLIKVQNDIDNHPYKLKYTVNGPETNTNYICDFINKNYIVDCETHYIYKPDTIKYYMNNALTICFYSKETENNKSKMIGLVIAKKALLVITDTKFNSVETNFLSICPKVRGNNLTPLIISILTKELILNYSIGISHYTISNPIKSPHFGLKYYFHRMINIKKLFDTRFIIESNDKIIDYIKIYNDFKNYLPEQKILYFNKKITPDISDDFINLICKNINLYSKHQYKIYELKTFEQIKQLFNTDTFHHFLFVENNLDIKKPIIKNYICINQIDVLNKSNNLSYSNGYIYMGFYENKLDIVIEKLSEFVWKNNIFDVITWSDLFNVLESSSKAIKGTGFLKYYLFNIKINPIPNEYNGIVTL